MPPYSSIIMAIEYGSSPVEHAGAPDPDPSGSGAARSGQFRDAPAVEKIEVVGLPEKIGLVGGDDIDHFLQFIPEPLFGKEVAAVLPVGTDGQGTHSFLEP